MAEFPRLKTQAVMQYPACRAVQFRNQTVRFLDGSEQCYRDFATPLRTWTVRLDLLDERELQHIDEFFQATQGQFGSFVFTDPWDGQEYPDCSLDQDELGLTFREELHGSTHLIVRENRR
jgi:hypothetical protein